MIKHKRGKGIVRRQLHHKYIHRTGNGIFDFLKPITNIVRGVFAHKDLISKAVNTAKDIYTIGKNTKDIITSIRSPPITDTDLEDIRKPPHS